MIELNIITLLRAAKLSAADFCFGKDEIAILAGVEDAALAGYIRFNSGDVTEPMEYERFYVEFGRGCRDILIARAK